MSRDLNLHLRVAEVIPGDRESLLEALISLSDFDADFTGENGEEYRWLETINSYCSSNQEYLIKFVVEDIKDDQECVDTFFREWMKRDGNYYKNYEVDYIVHDGNITFISVAAVS